MNEFGEVLICNDKTKFVEMTVGIHKGNIYFDIIDKSKENYFEPGLESLKDLQKFLNDNLK